MINQITSTPIKQHMYPQRERNDVKIDDQVSKPSQATSLSSESSQRIVNDKVIEQLDKVLQKSHANEIRTLDPKNYTPESVSKQILDFVKNAIDRADARGENVGGMIEQAKQGIDLGFKQAKNILTSLNALSGKIAEGVQQTYELINSGMEEIVKSFKETNEAQPSVTTVSTKSTSQESAFNLTIHTQDGDEINIGLDHSISNAEYDVQLSNSKETNVELHSVSSNSSRSFNISVSGELDEKEIAAIEVLLSDVKSVSDRFFDADVEAAFITGLKLGFNSKELVGFSLELNQNYSESASKAYREIGGFTTSNAISSKPAASEIDTLLAAIQSFSEPFVSTAKQIEEAPLFNENKQIAEQLFSHFSKSNNAHQASVQQLEALTGAPFNNLASDLFSAARNA